MRGDDDFVSCQHGQTDRIHVGHSKYLSRAQLQNKYNQYIEGMQTQHTFQSKTSTLDDSYIKAYLDFGQRFTEVPLLEKIKKKIEEVLPYNNFFGVDIGSPTCHYSDQIAQLAAENHKTGTFISIDPLPAEEKVMRCTAQEFIEHETTGKIDAILMKEVIHLIRNPREFLLKCHQKLNDGGVIAIFTLLEGTKLPWTQPLQDSWDKSNFDLPSVVPECFEVRYDVEWSQKKVPVQFMIGLLENRGWSNLLTNSNQEIKECLEMIKQSGNNLPCARIGAVVYYLQKKSK